MDKSVFKDRPRMYLTPSVAVGVRTVTKRLFGGEETLDAYVSLAFDTQEGKGYEGSSYCVGGSVPRFKGIYGLCFSTNKLTFSSAAREEFLETMDLGAAFAHGWFTHQEWIEEFHGNELEYAQFHAEFSHELERSFGRKGTLISVSKRGAVGAYFAGPTGTVYAAEVPPWELIPTVPGPEAEFVIRIGRPGFERVTEYR